MTQHTAGAVRAANKIVGGRWTRQKSSINEIARIIEEETHAAEMQALIDRMATISLGDHAGLFNLKRESLELLEKVRD